MLQGRLFQRFWYSFYRFKDVRFFFNISEEEAKQYSIKMTRYNNHWKRAVYFIEPGKTETEDYLQLFKIAHKKHGGAEESD
jgi:hypothetical protein